MAKSTAKSTAKNTTKNTKSNGAGKSTKAQRDGAGPKHGPSEKLVEYIGQAAGKERHIEAALAAHLVITTRPAYHERLEDHLRATKKRAEKLERRMKELGGSTRSISGAGSAVMGEVKDAAKMVADRAVSLAKGPLDAMRDDHEAETLLENARVEYSDACEQMGSYTVVRALAKAADDKKTVKLAKDFHDEHSAMAEFVEKLIPKLSTAVVKNEARGKTKSSSGATQSSGSSSGSGSSSSSSQGSGQRRGGAGQRSGSSTRASRAKSSAKSSSPARSSTTSSRGSSRAKAKTSGSGSRSKPRAGSGAGSRGGGSASSGRRPAAAKSS